LTHELRKDKLTLGLHNTTEGHEENKATLKELKDKMKDMMKKAIEQSPNLGPAIGSTWGSKWHDLVWVCIRYWFHNDFKASKMPVDQIWYVD
jgi:hypothetical protein